MKQNLLLAISLSIFSLAELVPVSKPSYRKNTVNAIPNSQNSKEVHPEVRNSAQTIADYAVSVNGSYLILRKETPEEGIIISTKIPAISVRNPIDPEYDICDKEGSFNVQLMRGTENIFNFVCLTPAFFNENSTYAVTRFRPDQPLTRTSVNDLMNVFTRASPLTDDRIRKILKDKDITLELIEIMLNEAKRRQD